jgi:anthranilate phosphoribosyltransferase
MAEQRWSEVLGALVRGDDLEPDAVEWAMGRILEGEATDAQIAGFALGLRAKGETPVELAALVETMLRFSEPVQVADGAIDTCGTGGDRAGTVNVSTMAALVAAGAGARVVKHGNRAASSQCGSADVLEALGVVIDLSPAGVQRCVEEAGIGFCFAQRFHPAMRFVATVRKELGVPTTFNFLGPLANPARVRRQVVGVSDPAMAERVIGTLSVLGAERAMVFYGHDGLDELTTTSTSTVFSLEDGKVGHFDVDSATFGFERVERSALAGGDAPANAGVVREVLGGASGPARDVVVLNAAAAIVVAGIAERLDAGVEVASEAIDSGRAADVLDAFVATSVAARDQA